MRYLAPLILTGILALTPNVAQTQTAPDKLTFPSKMGAVTFDHAAHVKREKNDCKVCHTALFPQDAKAALAYKPLHKTAEDKKTSCGSCHRPGGAAFESKGNCTNSKCHTRAAAK